VGENVNKIYLKISLYLNKFFRQIFIIAVAIVLIVISGIIFYHNYIINQEKCAEVALYQCQCYFENQEWKHALYGDNIRIGFLGIIKKFRGTKSSELAKAYAGICQYQLSDYSKALITLGKFHGKDKLFVAQIIGAMADCEINLGNVEKGIDLFLKASIKANNSFLSPIYLKKAAIAYESLKDYKSALDVYSTILNKYHYSLESTVAKKNIERIKNKMAINF
jgi:tetratricopeptide (TPR) repeat protein